MSSPGNIGSSDASDAPFRFDFTNDSDNDVFVFVEKVGDGDGVIRNPQNLIVEGQTVKIGDVVTNDKNNTKYKFEFGDHKNGRVLSVELFWILPDRGISFKRLLEVTKNLEGGTFTPEDAYDPRLAISDTAIYAVEGTAKVVPSWR